MKYIMKRVIKQVLADPSASIPVYYLHLLLCALRHFSPL